MFKKYIKVTKFYIKIIVDGAYFENFALRSLDFSEIVCDNTRLKVGKKEGFGFLREILACHGENE